MFSSFHKYFRNFCVPAMNTIFAVVVLAIAGLTLCNITFECQSSRSAYRFLRPTLLTNPSQHLLVSSTTYSTWENCKLAHLPKCGLLRMQPFITRDSRFIESTADLRHLTSQCAPSLWDSIMRRISIPTWYLFWPR